MNEIIADLRVARKARNKVGRIYQITRYDEVRARWKKDIAVLAIDQAFRPIEEPMHFTFLLFEPNRRRDPDNVSSGASKLLLDALQKLELLPNDSWRWIRGLASYWAEDKTNPRVVLFATKGWMSKEQAFLLERQFDEREKATG